MFRKIRSSPPPLDKKYQTGKAVQVYPHGQKYSSEFWLKHYHALIKKFPNYSRKIKAVQSKMRFTYLSALTRKNHACPSAHTFERQMKAIQVCGQPQCNPIGGPVLQIAETCRIPRHYELMEKYESLTPEEATERYNDEILRFYKSNTINKTVSRARMLRWRRLWKKRKANGKPVVPPQRQIRLQEFVRELRKAKLRQPKEGPPFGKIYCVYHLRKLIKEYPNFLKNYQNRMNGGEIAQYFAKLKEEGQKTPDYRIFYWEIAHILHCGTWRM